MTSWVLQNLRAIIADLAGESENISLHAAEQYKWRIGPFHIRKRMCVIYEYAIIEFDVTFGFHRGSQKSSKCIGVNGGTPYF